MGPVNALRACPSREHPLAIGPLLNGDNPTPSVARITFGSFTSHHGPSSHGDLRAVSVLSELSAGKRKVLAVLRPASSAKLRAPVEQRERRRDASGNNQPVSQRRGSWGSLNSAVKLPSSYLPDRSESDQSERAGKPRRRTKVEGTALTRRMAAVLLC
jgi:hypothetical protein